MALAPKRDSRRSSMAIKLHKSAAKGEKLSLPDELSSSPVQTKDSFDGDRPFPSKRYRMSIVGQTERTRAKSLDGGFFEEFVILDDKHEDQIEKAKKDAIKQDKTIGQASEISIAGAFSQESKLLEKDQTERMYCEIIHIVINQVGKRAVGKDTLTDGDLYVYAQEVLGINKEQHRRLYALAKQRKGLESLLKVTVKEAKNLEPKDANGFSDPYCMLALIKAGDGDKPSKDGKKIKKLVLRDFPDSIPVRTTSIKPNTLNPVWDENFLLKIESFQEEVLRIDVWDHDDDTVILDEDNRITSIKGFSGVGRFIKEVVQSAKCNESTNDDFLGIVEVFLKDIPSVGMDEWFELRGRSSRSQVQGQLHIKLELLGSTGTETTTDKKSNSASLKDRRQLWEQFIRHESATFFEEKPDEAYWNCEMSPQATCLLTQQAVQNALSKFQLLVCEWEVMAKLQKDVPIPSDKFMELAGRFKIYSNCNDLTADEEKVFVDSLEDFVNHAYQLLHKYRNLFPASAPEKSLKLGNMLLCLMTLYKLPIFQNYFPEKRLVSDLEAALQRSTLDWYSQTVAYWEPAQQTPYEKLASLVSLTNAVNVDLERSATYTKLFQTISIDYYTFVYNQLESLLIQSAKNRIAELSKSLGYGVEHDKVGTTMFELYIAIRHFKERKEYVPEEMRKASGIEEYYLWFNSAVVKWLDLAREKAILRIKKAVEIDEEHVVHDAVKYSASAVDVTCCLSQICMFWKNLQWPDPSGAFSFVAKITDIVSVASMEYGKIMLAKLSSVGYYDTVGRFDVSAKLCIAVNNLQHVLEFLDTIPSVLKFEDVIMEICSIHGADREETIRSTLVEVLECAKVDLTDKLKKVFLTIGDKMKPDIINYLNKIIQVSRGRRDFEAVDPLLEYLDQNLMILHDAVLTPVFQKILKALWKASLAAIEEFSKKNSKAKQETFEILIGVTEEVTNFFHGDGYGLPEKALQSPLAERVEKLLSVNAASTELVIQKYYKELCQEQATAVEKFGALEFKVFYSQRNKALHVAITHARNLPPLDTTGFSDPFVTLDLFPKHVFPNQQQQKTSIKQSTLFPIYDENFSFEIPAKTCMEEGATLVFTVYDHDMMSDNDIAGEVFYDLNNTVGIEREISGGFSCIQEIELPLIHGPLTSQSFKVLQERSDPKATAFVLQRQTKMKKMSADLKKCTKVNQSVQ